MGGPTVNLPIAPAPRNWNGLETLAEASRQVEIGFGENGEGSHMGASLEPERLNLQEQYTLENPPLSYEQRPSKLYYSLAHIFMLSNCN